MRFLKNKARVFARWAYLGLSLSFSLGQAQDLIVLRSGENLNVQILGITKDAIAFRHPNVPVDSISALPIVALKQIQYANGLEQFFLLPDEERQIIRQTPSLKSTAEIIMDTLVFRNGQIETGKVIYRRRFSLDIANQIGKKAKTIQLAKIHSIRYAGSVEEQVWPLYSFGNPFLKSQNFDCLPPHFLGFQTGINLPVGAYAESNNQNPNSGFATAGIQISVSGFFRIFNGWGLYLNGQRFNNPYNNGGLRQKLSDQLEALGFLASGPVKQSDWVHHTLFLGPSYYVHRGRFMGNLNLTFGLVFSEAPSNQIEGILDDTPVELTFSRDSKPSPAVSASLNMRYFFHRYIQGTASVQFTSAELGLGATQELVSSQSPTLPSATGVLITPHTKMPFISLAFQLGVLFSLPLHF